MNTTNDAENLPITVLKMQLDAGVNPEFVITGGSMIPLFYPGQKVRVRRTTIPRRGMVALFESKLGLAVHRIVQPTATKVLLKGDNSIVFDPPVESILGEVTQIEGKHFEYSWLDYWLAIFSGIHGYLASLLEKLGISNRGIFALLYPWKVFFRCWIYLRKWTLK